MSKKYAVNIRSDQQMYRVQMSFVYTERPRNSLTRAPSNCESATALVCSNTTATHTDSGRSFVLFCLMGQKRFTHGVPSTLNTRFNFRYLTNLQQNGWYTYRTISPLLIGYKNRQKMRGNGMNVIQ